jgi:hypothetical protein
MFECAYRSGPEEARVAFRAWSAEEAVRDLEEVLGGEGIHADGDITVRDARGRVVLHVPASRRGDAVGAA